jgi:hypothetical protein
MAYKKEYQLTDGSWTTVNKVAAEVGCPTTTAAGRLARHKDREKVFAPWKKQSGTKTKLYALDSGQIVTAKQVAKKLNCHISLARIRLNKSTDPAKVFGAMLSETEKEKRKQAMTNYAQRRIHSRGMFDEFFVMAMKGI